MRVDAVAVRTDELPERGSELHHQRIVQLFGPAHANADQIANGAARAVGRDHEAGAHDALPPRGRVAHRHSDRLGVDGNVDHFGAQLDTRVGYERR